MATGADPATILALAYERAAAHLDSPLVEDVLVNRIDFICRASNRSCARLVLAGTLAKMHRPFIDIRKPYTDIEGSDTYSGRYYDERYIGPLIFGQQLTLNTTTAFLTPAFRTLNRTLTADLNLSGRPAQLYSETLQLLADVQSGLVEAADVLAEVLRQLIVLRNEQNVRIDMLLRGLRTADEAASLSAEAILTLIQQHLASRNASLLPVLVVAAAYEAASAHLGERVLPLQAHNAADAQTGAFGDLEITLIADQKVITSYEMKDRRVTKEDIDAAMQKVAKLGVGIDNYIFITTDPIEERVAAYAATMYDKTNGIEVVVLDCVSFLRHFLHLFHRVRGTFLQAYQNLVLAEPDSAVSPALKEAFLNLRRVAEEQ